MAEIASNSKALPNNPLKGIFLRNFGNARLHDQPLPFTPIGCSVFVTPSALPSLKIGSSAIVGIENPACLLEFEKSQSHFPELQKSLVLVLRWCWGTAWNDWLSQWEGDLFYFPDYDPAGLRIFEHEVLDKNPKASLLIPPNLEFLLRQRGQRELFVIQERFLPVSHTHPQINFVADLLRKTRRGLEQEHLLY